MCYEWIRPEAVNLELLEFAVLSTGGNQDGPPSRVNLFGVLHTLGRRESENGGQHRNNVMIAVLVIIQ